MSDSEKPQSQISTSSILRDILARKMSRNPSFSLRAFARDLGVSHTYLSLVLSGKKKLSLKKVIQFCQILNLEDREASAFMKAASRETRHHALQRIELESSEPRETHAEEQQAYYELESDKYKVLDYWYHLPLLDLTLTRDFKNDPKWIARRLGISPEQVKDAVDRLKRLGLLEEHDGALIKTNRNLTLEPKQPRTIIRNYHKQMIGKALEVLEAGTDEDADSRDVYALTIPMDPAKLPEAKRRIAAFRRSLWKFLASGEKTELYQFNFQLVPLTKPAKSKGLVLKTEAKK